MIRIVDRKQNGLDAIEGLPQPIRLDRALVREFEGGSLGLLEAVDLDASFCAYRAFTTVTVH
jgi:hypothetical protein